MLKWTKSCTVMKKTCAYVFVSSTSTYHNFHHQPKPAVLCQSYTVRHAHWFPKHVNICKRWQYWIYSILCESHIASPTLVLLSTLQNLNKSEFILQNTFQQIRFSDVGTEWEKIAALHMLIERDKGLLAEKEGREIVRKTERGNANRENNRPLSSSELFLEQASLLHLDRS